MSLNTLLVSDQMVKDRTSIHGNIDPKLLYPDIKVAQDMYILPILGSTLFKRLQTDISTGAIAGDYKSLLDEYIVDCLVYYVLSDLPTSLSYQFWNKGLIRKSGENAELPSMSELIDISNKYKARAEFYGTRITKYLKENAASKYPEYLNPGYGADAIQPDKSTYTCPVYLGDD